MAVGSARPPHASCRPAEKLRDVHANSPMSIQARSVVARIIKSISIESIMLFNLLGRFLKIHVFRITSRPLREQSYQPAGIRLRQVDEAELLPYCADPEMQLPVDHVRAAFARGDVCAAAFDGGRLAGYEWFAHGRAPHIDSVWVEFAADARYAYKQFVRAQYRGRRIAAGLSTHVDDWHRRRGFTRAISMIDLDNNASWRSEARLGARTAGYAGYVRWFGRCIAFRSPGARRLRLRLYSSPGYRSVRKSNVVHRASHE
jgi:GNAT superfamily N-acetyltransferase